MRGLLSNACLAVIVGLGVRFGAELASQLQDSTSSLRLGVAELADRLREVTP